MPTTTRPPDARTRGLPKPVASLAAAAILCFWSLSGVRGADASAAAVPRPAIIVQPSISLSDGQSVVVTGSGFSASAQIAIAECEAGATSANQCSVAGVLVVATDASGGFATDFSPSRVITVGTTTIDCSSPGSCVIGAAELPTLTTYATAPIAFAPATPPGPVAPGSSSSRYYLALGDSLAVGFGAPTGQGYVDDLAAYYGAAIPGLALENLSCSGETTTTFRDGGKCPYAAGSQLAQAEAFLAGHRGQTALVTIDIGGDDITGCASTAPPFLIGTACVANAVATAEANLEEIGAGLRAAAGPSVPIVGMTYYDPFVVEWLAGPDGQAAAKSSVADLEQLNAPLASAYGSFGARVADAQDAFFSTDFADLVASPFGTIPKNVATACSWLLVVCSASPVVVGVHPNATGYGVVASAFEAALPTTQLGLSSTPPAAAPITVPSQPLLAYSGFPSALLGGLGAAAIALGLALVALSRSRRPVRRTSQ